MSEILDGKTVSAKLKENVKNEVELLKSKGISVSIAVIIVGDNPASRVYVNNKKKACDFCGIVSKEFALSEDVSEEELFALIDKLNSDNTVNGILCQLPLPKHISEEKVLNRISFEKDIDAFHPVNVGKIMIGNYDFLPCTPQGIMELLKYYNIQISGKNCVVIGRSNIVGKPMSMLLLHSDGTVTICHSKTKNLKSITLNADILVVAVGKAGFLTADMVKEGAVVVDVGMNRVDGKLCGDVDFCEVCKKASYITPVPGGVGPMTIATLMKNGVIAAKKQNNFKD